jgi:plastocyanin
MAGRRVLVGVVAVVWVLMGASAGSAAPATHQIKIVDFSFSPSALSVQPGDTVVWTNHGTVDHTVTADNGSFNSGSLSPGQSFSHTFNSAGVVAYHCQFHGAAGGIGMSGRITVNSAPAATTVPTTIAAAPPTTHPAADTTAPPATAAAQVPATVTPTTSAPELVRTGANDLRMAILALALIAIGFVGLAAVRSRTRRARAD